MVRNWILRAGQRIESALALDRTRVALLVAGAGVYLLAYLGAPDLPGNHPTHPAEAWWGWWDQGNYLKTTRAIATGTLAPDSFWYPLGYSLLAVPFWYFAPKHAFLVPDLGLAMAFAIALWRIARLHVTRFEALLLTASFVALHAWTLRLSFVVPWNSIPTAAIFAWGIFLLLARADRAGSLGLSALAAAAVWFRPIDAMAMAPMLVVSVLRLPRMRDRWLAGAGGVGMIVASALAVGLVNRWIFGTWESEYDRIATRVGFMALPLTLKGYWLFVDPSFFFAESYSGLLVRFPWLVLSPAALVAVVHRHGWRGAGVVATIVLSLAVYLAFNDFHPLNLLRFKLIHYILWPLPLLYVFAYVCLTRGWRHPVLAGAIPASLALSALVLALHIEPAPASVAREEDALVLGPDRPMVLSFPTLPADSRPRLTLDGKPALPFRDYLTPWRPEHLRLILTCDASGTRLRLDGPGPTPEGTEAWTVRWSLASPFRHFPARNEKP